MTYEEVAGRRALNSHEVKLPVLPHGAPSHLRRNPPKQIHLRQGYGGYPFRIHPRPSGSSSRPSIRNSSKSWCSWRTTMRPRGLSKRSWTCPTGRSISSFGTACRTMADSRRGNVQATLIPCRKMKSLAWNKQSSPPTEAIRRMMHDEYMHSIFSVGCRTKPSMMWSLPESGSKCRRGSSDAIMPSA